MMSKIKSLISRCMTTSSPKQNGAIQQCTIDTMSKTNVTTQVLHDYGYYCCAPVNSIGVCMTPRCEENDRVSIVYSPQYYGKPLTEGEVLVGNFLRDATLKFDEAGNARLVVPKDVIIECVNATTTCSGDSTVTCVNSTTTASGSASIDCDSATISASSSFDVSAGSTASITAPQIALNGAVTGTGGMAVTGGMTSEGIEVSKSDHKHDAGTLLDSSGGQCTGKTSADAGP